MVLEDELRTVSGQRQSVAETLMHFCNEILTWSTSQDFRGYRKKFSVSKRPQLEVSLHFQRMANLSPRVVGKLRKFECLKIESATI